MDLRWGWMVRVGPEGQALSSSYSKGTSAGWGGWSELSLDQELSLGGRRSRVLLPSPPPRPPLFPLLETLSICRRELGHADCSPGSPPITPE